MIVGDLEGMNPALSVHAEVQLFPMLSTFIFSMLVRIPLALTTDYEPGTVNDEIDRTCEQILETSAHFHRLIPAGKGCVVRTGKIQAHQLQQGPEKPFGLSQPLMEKLPECQSGLDGQIRIQGLATELSGLWRCPRIDGFLPEANGDIAAGSK